MSRTSEVLAPADRAFLLRLQKEAIDYFLDNQMPCGLFLDRQANHGHRRAHGLCSTSSTGMGFIALAVAAADPHNLLTSAAASLRIRTALQTALDRLPHERGVMPHFVHSSTGEVYGCDHLSTIDSAWMVAGALWAAEFLQDSTLASLANVLYERVDWNYWTGSQTENADPSLLLHGKGHDGAFLRCAWDRLNGETAFMYVLAAGAHDSRAIPPYAWQKLQPFYGRAGGFHFNNADLGLFVFQYGLDLLDLQNWQAPGDVNLMAEAHIATLANKQACRELASQFKTYQDFWGLSAGDGPGNPGRADAYQSYSPSGPVDGTAHLTATLAAAAHCPDDVLDNLRKAEGHERLPSHGRYGFSNLNVDRNWVAQDMVGIDAGAAVLALDNFLMNNRVRNVFHRIPSVNRGLERFRFIRPDAGTLGQRSNTLSRQAS